MGSFECLVETSNNWDVIMVAIEVAEKRSTAAIKRDLPKREAL